jgi:ClpP class serine protease
LEALKKDTSLNGVRKIERVREIASSIDEKLKPLINPEQQQKFQALREELRKRFIEKMASEAKQKAEAGVESWFTDKSVK